MIEKAVTSVAVPEVEEMAQKCALRRSGGMLAGQGLQCLQCIGAVVKVTG